MNFVADDSMPERVTRSFCKAGGADNEEQPDGRAYAEPKDQLSSWE
jgi:hypothetical protein